MGSNPHFYLLRLHILYSRQMALNTPSDSISFIHCRYPFRNKNNDDAIRRFILSPIITRFTDRALQSIFWSFLRCALSSLPPVFLRLRVVKWYLGRALSTFRRTNAHTFSSYAHTYPAIHYLSICIRFTFRVTPL